MKRLVIDLDGCIAGPKNNSSYSDCPPISSIIRRLREYKNNGFEVIIHTSRNMRTYEGNIGKITANTVPVIVEWLEAHSVPYDELWVAKPWCGTEGFYVDDRAIRPDEFVSKSYEQILNIVT